MFLICTIRSVALLCPSLQCCPSSQEHRQPPTSPNLQRRLLNVRRWPLKNVKFAQVWPLSHSLHVNMNPKGIQGSVHYSVPRSRVQGSVEDQDIHVNSERKLQLARHLLEGSTTINMIQQMNRELSFEQTRKTELQNVFEELFNNFEARYGLTN